MYFELDTRRSEDLPAVTTASPKIMRASFDNQSDYIAVQESTLLDLDPPRSKTHAAATCSTTTSQEAYPTDSGNGYKESYLELRRLLLLAGPLLVQNVFGYGLSLVSAAFVGHLHDAAILSSAVMANSFFNVTGQSVMVGLAAGMETLCGQAFGGGNYRMLGLVLQRALLICWLACVPISLLWSQSHWVLQHLGQPRDIVEGASHYLILILPSLYCSATAECLRRYLLAQRVVTPGMVTTIITTLLAPVYNWFFMFKLNLGLTGAAYAFNLSQVTSTLLLLGYILYRDYHLRGHPQQTFMGCSMQAFRGWGQYLNYGAPAAAMICMEWWAYEVVIIMAGVLHNAEVAVGVMGLCFQISSTVYMVALSLGSSANIRVANELGAGHPIKARRVFRVSICLVFLTQSILAVLAIVFRRYAALALTNTREVVALTMQVMPVVGVTMLGDGLNCVLGGTLRGSGRQGIGAGLNVLGYWGVGVPLAALFALHLKLNVTGFWLGLMAAIYTVSVVQGVFIGRFDWSHEAKRAQVLVLGSWEGASKGDIEDEDEGTGLLDDAEGGKVMHGGDGGGGRENSTTWRDDADDVHDEQQSLLGQNRTGVAVVSHKRHKDDL